MVSEQDSIVLRIDRETPLSLEQLTFGMMSLGAEYERFVRKKFPQSQEHESDLLVRRVAEGSIIIELIGAMQPVLGGMDNILIFKEFVNLIGTRLSALSAKGGRLEDPTTRELEHMTRMAETIVGDPKGEAQVFAMRYNSTSKERTVEAEVMFRSKDAEAVIENTTAQIQQLKSGASDVQRGVLMQLFQTNLAGPEAEKSSGEKGIIESISPFPRRLIYASEMAGKTIKGAWAREGVSPYDLVFVVDVDVQTVGGKPRAYRIVDVQQVIEPDDDE